MEELYTLYAAAVEDGEGSRAAERRIARAAGMDLKYLKGLVKQMPPGLINDDDQLTLRRAVNDICGINNDKRKFTPAELRNAVLGSFLPGTVNADIGRRFGVGTSALYTHRKALLKWRQAGGTDDGASVCVSVCLSVC